MTASAPTRQAYLKSGAFRLRLRCRRACKSLLSLSAGPRFVPIRYPFRPLLRQLLPATDHFELCEWQL